MEMCASNEGGDDMHKTLILAATLAFALSTGALAKEPCHDPKTGKFIKCPPPAAAHATQCKLGKPCGGACIAKDKVCHVKS
jgi:hypothetical protein